MTTGTEDGSLHGSFRNEQMMASVTSEVEDAEENRYANKPQTVVEALAYFLGHYDWQPGRESGA